MNNSVTFRGMKVVVANCYPKMQLSESCPVSDGFREKFNRWLLDFFGWQSAVPRGLVYHSVYDNSVVMHPADYATLKALKFQSEFSKLSGGAS